MLRLEKITEKMYGICLIWQLAVEKASYISRSILVSEYDGQTYRPKYHEDLVHSEITLPSNAPKEYAD